MDTNARWLAQLFCTEPANRLLAEAAVGRLYAAAGFDPPRTVWFESPFAAYWAFALLIEPHDWMWRAILDEARQKKASREKIERTQAHLCQSLGASNWDAVIALAGPAMGRPGEARRPAGVVWRPTAFAYAKSLQSELLLARIGLYENPAHFSKLDDKNDLFRAETRFLSAVGSSMNSLLGRSFSSDYPFYRMAMDEAEIGNRTPPPIVAAAWDLGRSAGFWWPFMHLALMSDRPTEAYTNKEGLLHRGDGPALLYRDGSRVYAWAGFVMPENWILHPETIPPGKLKQCDAAFREQVAKRVGEDKVKPAGKASAVLKLELKGDVAARLEQLRKQAGGRTPFFDRYVAGEHEKVWSELIALGPTVRENDFAADALAVAYETMRRVEANVSTIVERLRKVDYKFKNPNFVHPRPDAQTWKRIQRMEKLAGAMPLSLRAFYEVVGSVDWTGQHPSIAPKDGQTLPDPLTVCAIEDALAFYEGMEPQEDDETEIIIAPDDLHKADTSGGEPYGIAIPDLRADGELLNERHNLFFINYLRLCFRYGGFPGYEGMDRGVPPELGGLSEGLLVF